MQISQADVKFFFESCCGEVSTLPNRSFSLFCCYVAKNFLGLLAKLLLYRFLALGFWGIMCIQRVLLLLNLLW